MIIDCISDLHGYFPTLEGGDLLILAGDYTAANKIPQWCEFFEWVKNQPYRKKVLIAGNHDGLFESGFPKNKKEADELREVKKFLNIEEDFEYLCDSGTIFEYEEDNIELEECGIHPTEVKTLKIWGSPWTKTFEGMNPKCKAFTCDTEEELAEKWALIPDDVDILITHGPPYGILDEVKRFDYPNTQTRLGRFLNKQKEYVGSKSLYSWLQYVGRPKLHVFGQIHEGYGQSEVFPTYNDKMMNSVNASHVNERYQPVNPPIRIIL